ncbi:hypothetical protein R6242_17270 [Iodobacter sp. CM08]|uniref:hypothetical protein n=1 Tax=Iodobacter sp. CM08 TaxID=3085902 RepID=UPI002980F5C8|nr:hypothetical protein [Iodobacter sp. CM08]MDW5418320.1 hypothetical protein [Iodobacter sp. CM08]
MACIAFILFVISKAPALGIRINEWAALKMPMIGPGPVGSLLQSPAPLIKSRDFLFGQTETLCPHVNTLKSPQHYSALAAISAAPPSCGRERLVLIEPVAEPLRAQIETLPVPMILA